MLISGGDLALILGAGITTLGSITIAIIKSRMAACATNEASQAKAEMQTVKRSMDFAGFVGKWTQMHEKVSHIIDNTDVDRFLLLRAWNGSSSPRWTTAVIQLREADQDTVSYVHFELDPDHVNRLREVLAKGSAYYVIEDLPDVSIKEVYEAEGVTATLWVLLDRKEYMDGTASITYASYSTHKPEGLSKATQVACKLNADEIKGIVNKFYD